MRKTMMLWGLFPLFLLGCPVAVDQGDPVLWIRILQNRDGGFSLNPECGPSRPLVVTLGQGGKHLSPGILGRI